MAKYRTTWQHNLLVTITAAGMSGALAEICTRGGDTLPQSFFKRVCKRNGVGNLELRTALRRLEWVPPRANFPMPLTAPSLTWDTFHGWKDRGFRVMLGETATGREARYGRAVFDSLQVKRYER